MKKFKTARVSFVTPIFDKTKGESFENQNRQSGPDAVENEFDDQSFNNAQRIFDFSEIHHRQKETLFFS